MSQVGHLPTHGPVWLLSWSMWTEMENWFGSRFLTIDKQFSNFTVDVGTNAALFSLFLFSLHFCVQGRTCVCKVPLSCWTLTRRGKRTKTNETRSCILKAARRQRKREGEGLYDQAEVEMRARLMYRLITVQLHHPSLRNKCVCFLLISHQPRRRHGTRAVIRWSTYLYLMIHNYFIFISCWCVVGKFSR